MIYELALLISTFLGLSIFVIPFSLLRTWTRRQASSRFDSSSACQRHPTKLDEQVNAKRPLKVVFLHPDLGIGGAERLVVDAAIALQRYQKVTPVQVIIVTNHHDPQRAFAETVDGTVTVQVFGSWLPASIKGRAKVFAATLRMCWAAWVTCWMHPDADCFMVDQVAAVLPLLSFVAPQIPRLFYCHFPDQCCDGNRDENQQYKKKPSIFRLLYRKLFDEVEVFAMNYASSIVSNSKFSRAATLKVFPKLSNRIDAEADIFYPPVSLAVREGAKHNGDTKVFDTEELDKLRDAIQGRSVVLSINRYERKKNLVLAIEAFARLLNSGKTTCSGAPLLVLAGGYDTRLEENVAHLNELQKVADTYKLMDSQILFLKNITELEKRYLLSQCCCLLYTPTSEHFGIVPTEAMISAKPVVAVNRGGPCESVGEGGTLCDPTPEAFAEAILLYMNDDELRRRVGEAGRKRASDVFTIERFGEKLATRFVKLWTETNAAMGRAAFWGKWLEGGKKAD
ncbi:dolichyl-P-Man:GDP-Man1GlcNAc2-PP-dolichyl alpha-1 [Trypanosoma brucei equiperdum]|uniref:Alpha-1,3/1,6-mannosyltransferase ALG2 n=1 Tax=Trypanosoma brucei equiperdum TaxID=630700 RepID=A0A3L6L9D6_9TRYP|nr:dolichyl-P-Man:GDP-Man1GlcNAc2-PP-dolichyl alpha-1 [Trypanosoma brucei equiperdum]